jgi:hypothetical protein
MTTDLTGDFDLEEEEFDWDVFVPDPDEAEIAAAAAALEDEEDLPPDDSDLDWEAAFRDEPQPEGDGGAGAAFERIVDTVRRSVEEPEAESPTEHEFLMEPEPAVGELEDEVELDLGAEFEVEQELELEPGFDVEPEPQPHAEFGTLPGPPEDEDPWAATETDRATAQEPDVVWDADVILAAVAPPESGTDWQFDPEPEAHPALPPAETGETAIAGATTAAPRDEATAEWGAEPAAPVWSPEALPEHDDGAAPSDGGPTRVRTRTTGGRGRSGVFTATLVLACLVLVALAATLAVKSLHPKPLPTSPPAHAVHPPVSPDAARIDTATEEVGSATTGAQAAIASMTSFPTPASVATIINPYVSSLQLYETALAGSKVPPPAATAAATAEAEARQDLTFLDTIHGLPPVQLGAFLNQVRAETAQLQTTLSGLEQSLRTPTT